MKKLKWIKLFETFSSDEKNKQLFDFIDGLEVEDYIKNSLKSSEDLIIIWNTHYAFNKGIKDLMELFEEKKVDYWNDYIKELGQNSYIGSFYDGVDDFISVLDRVNRYLKHPEVSFIFGEIFGYCNPPALRYLSDRCIDDILKNKDLIRKFQSLWEGKIFGPDGKTFYSLKWKTTGVKPFVPTSDKEHEQKISEIIMDKFDK